MDTIAPNVSVDEGPSMNPSELVDHLESTHHAYLNEAFPRLTSLLAKVVDAHGTTHRELHRVQATFLELRRDLEPHLQKEEQILFPLIRQLYLSVDAPDFHCGSIRNPIGVMCLEHERAGELFAQLRHLTSGYTTPEDGCTSYDALYAGLAELEVDTHLHIHKENNLLFPVVLAEESRRATS